jgi:hypothetical protein
VDRGVGFCSVVAIAAHASVIALNMNCCAAPFTACARGPPLTRSSGASVGGGSVHGGQERGQRIGSRNTARDRRNVGGHFRNPRGDDPRVGVSLRWLTEP